MGEFSLKRPRYEVIVHELTFHDGCEDLDKKTVFLITSCDSVDSLLGKNVYFNFKKCKNCTNSNADGVAKAGWTSGQTKITERTARLWDARCLLSLPEISEMEIHEYGLSSTSELV